MRSAAAATALGITLTLAGLASCAGPGDPVEPPSPDPSVTPVFASDEEALAAAEELYGRYLQAENALGQGGWVDLSLIEPFVRGDALDAERESAKEFEAQELHQIGDIVFDSVTLQQFDDLGETRVSLTVYLCLDFSSASISDVHDDPIDVGDRPDRVPLEVSMDDADSDLQIVGSEPWSGTDFC